NGRQIAYSYRPSFREGSNLFVKLVGGGTELRVTDSPGSDLHPAWSPDGKWIAFFRSDPGSSGWYVVSALGGPVRQILPAPDEDGCSSIDWFPGGRHVAVSLGDPSAHGLRRIASVDIDTGEHRFLTQPDPAHALGDQQPKVSPDGRTVAFVRERAACS